MATVGSRLKHLRETKAWTQSDLSVKAGVTALTILRIENGKTHPRLPTVRKLADALGVDPGWLLFGEDESNDAREHKETPR